MTVKLHDPIQVFRTSPGSQAGDQFKAYVAANPNLFCRSFQVADNESFLIAQFIDVPVTPDGATVQVNNDPAS